MKVKYDSPVVRGELKQTRACAKKNDGREIVSFNSERESPKRHDDRFVLCVRHMLEKKPDAAQEMKLVDLGLKRETTPGRGYGRVIVFGGNASTKKDRWHQASRATAKTGWEKGF